MRCVEVKKSYMFLFALILIILPINVSAYEYPYEITKYDINLVVNENNVLDITENISAQFNIERHGILRTIPLKNKVERLDGTKTNNIVEITNISVNEIFTTYSESGNKVIKIGNPDYAFTGPKNYTINYSYNLGKDKMKEYDELYFNIIGLKWDTTINNVTFKIVMPKEFDSSKLGFSSGVKYSTNNENINYYVKGNTITGNYVEKLNPGEALTIRLELPEGYFVGASDNFNYIIFIPLILTIIFLLLVFLMWKIRNPSSKIIETVEFYPPEGYNSLEVAFLYNCGASNKDVISLFVYLANKGYLKIVETGEKILFSNKKKFKFVKQKEYDGNNLCERLFISGLFRNSYEVDFYDLQYSFYKVINEILDEVNTKENEKGIIKFEILSLRFLTVLMIMSVLILSIFMPIREAGVLNNIFAVLLFPLVTLGIIFYILFSEVNNTSKRVLIFFVFLFGQIPLLEMLISAVQINIMNLINYIVGIISMAIMLYLLKNMNNRTKYGYEIFGKIKGFRRFLIAAEKPKLEALVMENPTYFYDILPFTYVLGVSDKWIEKFESLNLQSPSWYDGGGSFSFTSFSSFMSETMATVSSSSSSGSSSGGSSGGGSSGGGSGGGGGSSW